MFFSKKNIKNFRNFFVFNHNNTKGMGCWQFYERVSVFNHLSNILVMFKKYSGGVNARRTICKNF